MRILDARSLLICLLRVCLLLMLAVPTAHDFKILSALTEACHEKITLGTIGLEQGGFQGDGLPSTATLLSRFIERVKTDGIPEDEGSRGLRRENSNRYGWNGLTDAERYIFSSFLAGVRAPDTGGYSIVDFSQIRGNHIRDDQQSAHFLRRKTHDENDGDLAVIRETTTKLTELANQALEQWAQGGPSNLTVRWTFAFYGERDVTVFGPAYHLGLIAHAIQDSYSHALRDDHDLRVIAIANYLEIVLDGHAGPRDGPGHSERLDQCNPNDAFDLPRIAMARQQTARAFNALDQQFSAATRDNTAFVAVLGQIFDYKSGCNQTNQYCGGEWYKKSIEEISEPYEVGCGLIDKHRHGPRSDDRRISTSLYQNAMIFFLLIVVPLLAILGLRRRAGL